MQRHISRNSRDLARAHSAGDAIMAAGGTATDVVLEGVAFMMRPQFIHDSIKAMAARAISLGANHPVNRDRFSGLSCFVLRYSLARAIPMISGSWLVARDKLWRFRAYRERALAKQLRRDLLLLRWLRRYHRQEIPGILEALTRGS